MLNATDLTTRLDLPLETIAFMHAKKILPEPVKIGGECRWRVEDIELFEDYLLARIECRDQGIDPDSPDGPAVPVYSMGLPRLDPREVTARIAERERQSKSRTLAAGSAPIAPQQPVVMPEAASKTEAK